MKKTKKQKIIFIAFVIFTMLAMYGYVPMFKEAKAVDSLTDARDLISESDVFIANVTHTFTFTSATTTAAGGLFRIEFPGDFTNILNVNVTCGYGYQTLVASTTGNTIDCTSAAGIVATSTRVIVTGVTNPGVAGSKLFNIWHYSNNILVERVQVMVAIIDNVTMTATVDATLGFVIAGTSTGAVVNGVACTATTTATSTPFGTLPASTPRTVCQMLTVETNADDGYTVTVEQDHELLSNSSSTINSFNNSQDATGSTTPQVWAAPAGILDVYNTYGHMGLTSDDATLDNSVWGEVNPYNVGAATEYVGFSNTVPVQVMYHDGPSDKLTQNKGLIHVAYTAEIMALQEAGDYQNTLTYICTPQY